MREILFRGKRIDTGKWVEGEMLHDMQDRPHLYWKTPKELPIVFSNHAIVDPATLGQFTGLTDENGTKIFEGDIVEIAKEDEPFKVEWCEDSARFILSASTFCCDFDNYWGWEMEVIGNIHDNPELLGGAEDA